MNSESPVLRPLSAILREIGIDSVHSENIRTLHSELVAILESIPVEHRIRSTEGGGHENLLASLAVSVARMQSALPFAPPVLPPSQDVELQAFLLKFSLDFTAEEDADPDWAEEPPDDINVLDYISAILDLDDHTFTWEYMTDPKGGGGAIIPKLVKSVGKTHTFSGTVSVILMPGKTVEQFLAHHETEHGMIAKVVRINNIPVAGVCRITPEDIEGYLSQPYPEPSVFDPCEAARFLTR